MASPTFHESLPDHLSRVRLTTFHQLVDYLLATRYTPKQYTGLTAAARNKAARRDVAEAIKRGEEAGKLVQDEAVMACGKNPRAALISSAALRQRRPCRYPARRLPKTLRVLAASRSRGNHGHLLTTKHQNIW